MINSFTLKINKKAILQYLLCFCAFSFCGAFWFELYKMPLLALTCCITFYIFVSSRDKRLGAPIVMSLFILFSIMFVRVMSDGGIGITDWLIISSQWFIAYLVFEVDEKKALRRFVNVCAFFCIISLMFYVVQTLKPNILRMILPSQYWNKIVYGKWFYVFRPYNLSFEGSRNNGIFTEPGRYQVVVSAALFILFFFKDRVGYHKKVYLWLILLFTVTMITIGSTTGFISLAILVAFFMLNQESDQRRLKQNIVIAILFGIIILLIEYNLKGLDSILGKYVINKFATTDINDQASSGGARLRIIKASWETIKERPWGAGHNYITMKLGVNSAGAGLFRFIAALGLIPSIPLFVWILNRFFKQGYWLVGVCFILMYLNTGSAQTYAVYSPYVVCSVALLYNSYIDKSSDDSATIKNTVNVE